MSNIMHKVKDAVTGRHDKQTSRDYNKSDNLGDNRDTMESSNPQTTGSSGMGSNTRRSDYQTEDRPDFQRDDNLNTGRAGNAGPHDSAMANKMDPRVDNDRDNRGTYGGNTGFQNTGDDSYGSNPSNMASARQPGGANTTSQESYSTSSQEHQSHQATSQSTSQMDPNAMSGLDSRAGQQGLGGGQQGFGGGAAGGSSNDNNFGTRGPSGLQDSDPLNKLDPRVRGNEQQNTMGNQRSGY
jgi:hypothetical protein